MYEGSPNPEIPVANKYPREKILGMDNWTNWFVQKLGLLSDVKQLVTMRLPPRTMASKGLQFTDLPAEIQLNILGRVSPTAREVVPVSHGMRQLADVVLMDSIRSGDLVDPTIGIPEREEYFKLDADGNGEYFSSQPGLWRSVQKYRNERRGDPYTDYRPAFYSHDIDLPYTVSNIPLLLYGTIHAEKDHSVKGIFVSLASINSDTEDHEEYGAYPIYSVSPYGDTRFDIEPLIYRSPELHDEVVKYFTSGTAVGEREFHLPISARARTSTSDEYVSARVVSLTNEVIYSGQLIFPSVRDDVLTL